VFQALKTDPSLVKPDDKSLTFRSQQSELCHFDAIGGWVTTGVGQKFKSTWPKCIKREHEQINMRLKPN